MATFLLEIGTEELPADFAGQAPAQLQTLAQADLARLRIGCGQIHASSTPRRLVLRLEQLADQQLDLEEERRGPPAGQAFRNGEPTAAALGFASRCGIEPSALEVRDTAKGQFVFARTREPGRPTLEVLVELVPAWIAALQGRRFMRWGEGDSRFSRPLRWLVALLDEQVVPIELNGCDPPLRAGRSSRGHRLCEAPVSIASAASYQATLVAAGVQVERAARAAGIRTAIEQAAAAAAAIPDLPPELFEELVDLVEAPQLIEGAVEQRFLSLPPEVLATVMRAHQRYVPLVRLDAADDPLALEASAVLLPRFLCVSNGDPEAVATIRAGNERVLRARLADAEFFVRADLSVPSIDRRDRLAAVTFAEGLGNLRERSERLEWLVDVLLEHLEASQELADSARRAAHLCKHDLVSQMVGEFPELQGVIGGKYLLAEGEPRAVALAVLEHYMPRGAGDALPSSAAGAVVALAERLELLLSIFARGDRPSGSSDPYGLRRAGNGLLQILWQRDWSLDLDSLLERTTAHWGALFPQFQTPDLPLAADLAEFLRQRVVSLLEEEGVDADLVQAVAGPSVGAEKLLRDPADARQRSALLSDLRQAGRLAGVQAVVQRASRLAVNSSLDTDVLGPSGVIDPDLFASPSEAAMLAELVRLEPLAVGGAGGNYATLAAGLAAAAPCLEAFFDGPQSVMVMAEDAAVRRNRLNLLAVLRNQAAVLADFSCLSG